MDLRLDGGGRERERERAESHKDRKWRLLDSTEEEEEEAGGVHVVGRHLFGLLCFPDSPAFPGFLPHCVCQRLFQANR